MSTASTENASLKPAADEAVPLDLRPPQFTLRFLFLLTAVVAATTALAVGWGISTLPASIGMAVSAANAAGMLAYVQRHTQARAAIVTAAWGFFLLSLALPSVIVFGEVSGWAAAWTVLTIIPNVIAHILGFNDPSESMVKPIGALLLYGPLSVANFILILAPLCLWLQRYRWSWWITQIAPICASAAWIIFALDDGTKALVGYYVWCASFLIFISSQRIAWQTWCGMMATIGLMIALKYGGF